MPRRVTLTPSPLTTPLTSPERELLFNRNEKKGKPQRRKQPRACLDRDRSATDMVGQHGVQYEDLRFAVLG